MSTSIHRKSQRLLAIAAKAKRPLDRRPYVELGLTRVKSQRHEGRVS